MSYSDDYRDWPVRSYIMTSGQAHPSRNTIRPETLLVSNPEMTLPISASLEQASLFELCQGMLSLAEAAAHLALPVSIVIVIASDLVDTGHLIVHSAPARHTVPDHQLLEKLLNGLRSL